MKRLLFLTILLPGVLASAAPPDTLDVVFVATAYYIDTHPSWLHDIKQWNATAVCIRYRWENIQPDDSSDWEWASLDRAIAAVQDSGLKVHSIRLSFAAGGAPEWAHPDSTATTPFESDDFHHYKDGSIMEWGQPNTEAVALNFTSERSRNYMLKVLDAFLGHLSTNIVKEIVPTLSPYDEAEYALTEHTETLKMVGFSVVEKDSFRSFLKNKYDDDIAALRAKWGLPTSFDDWDEIDPATFNWHLIDTSGVLYLSGRVDWMDFRTSELKRIIDDFASHIHAAGFRMGLQLGSIYDDDWLEYRGWYDPTPLVENVDAVRVADVPPYLDNFDFAADYLRSICRFWTVTNGRQSDPITFSTETNGYCYVNPGCEVNDWIAQLEAYYSKGSDSHFVMHWPEVGRYSQALTDTDIVNQYKDWIDTLDYYTHRPKPSAPTSTKGVHLGCEFLLFGHEGPSTREALCELQDSCKWDQDGYDGDPIVDPLIYKKFETCKSVLADGELYSPTYTYESGNDIVTNYMIARNPTYCMNAYSSLYFAKSSQYISEAAYKNLMSREMDMTGIGIYNATWFSDNGHGEYAYTAGLFDEYGQMRSPIHLVWRTRGDLRDLFPGANKPDSAEASEKGWPADSDFVSWAKKYGCGYPNETKREYPDWEVGDNASAGTYGYDEKLRAVWDQDSDLPLFFGNGHNRDSSGGPNLAATNMIEYARFYGYQEYPTDLTDYNNWPYIGTQFKVTISGPGSLYQGQSYTYTTTVNGGSEEYLYQWYQKIGSGSWTALGTASSQSVTMGSSSFNLKVEVVDGESEGYCLKTKLVIKIPPPLNEGDSNVPTVFQFDSNFPNPFNPETVFSFAIPSDSKVTLQIFDIIGRKVATIVDETLSPGWYQRTWNIHGVNEVASGVYFMRFEAVPLDNSERFTKIGKAVVTK